MVGYNVQMAADTKHHLIVAHDAINAGHDRSERWPMEKQAREAVSKEKLEVIADRGYYTGTEILACEQAGIKTLVPTPMTSNSKAEGRLSKLDFIYIARVHGTTMEASMLDACQKVAEVRQPPARMPRTTFLWPLLRMPTPERRKLAPNHSLTC